MFQSSIQPERIVDVGQLNITGIFSQCLQARCVQNTILDRHAMVEDDEHRVSPIKLKDPGLCVVIVDRRRQQRFIAVSSNGPGFVQGPCLIWIELQVQWLAFCGVKFYVVHVDYPVAIEPIIPFQEIDKTVPVGVRHSVVVGGVCAVKQNPATAYYGHAECVT